MARILIVGCGCRGRELGRALAERGHSIRGTSRSEEGRAAIEAAGLDGVLADPDRLGTLLPHLQNVSVLCWLMGTAEDPALHTERFPALLETLVDTHVRGVVHEAAAGAAAAARHARETYRMPVALVTESPGDARRWLPAALRAVDDVLGA
jgi:nucleoside-diphosphate-sugar epimerase